MSTDSDKNIFNEEFEKLGETGVAAKLDEGIHDPAVSLAAREFLYKCRLKRENDQRKQDLKSIRLTAQSSFALAITTILLVAVTLYGIMGQTTDNQEQRSLVKELLEQQKASSEAQRTDVHSLMEVQISVELDKQFDSTEMRSARRRLAS